MRPDKKKTRHHDSEKSKKKALEKAKSASTSKEPTSKAPKQQLPPPQPKIVSNWAQIEIPSEDEEDSRSNDDWGDTGPKFEYVLQNADKSDSHFRTKIEKEWADVHAHFTSESFSLDVHRLNSAVSVVPLHEILEISPSELPDKFLHLFNQEAAKRLEAHEESYPNDKNKCMGTKAFPQESDESLSKKLVQMNVKQSSSPPSSKHEQRQEGRSLNENDEVEELEEWLDNFLD